MNHIAFRGNSMQKSKLFFHIHSNRMIQTTERQIERIQRPFRSKKLYSSLIVVMNEWINCLFVTTNWLNWRGKTWRTYRRHWWQDIDQSASKLSNPFSFIFYLPLCLLLLLLTADRRKRTFLFGKSLHVNHTAIAYILNLRKSLIHTHHTYGWDEFQFQERFDVYSTCRAVWKGGSHFICNTWCMLCTSLHLQMAMWHAEVHYHVWKWTMCNLMHFDSHCYSWLYVNRIILQYLLTIFYI